MNPSCCCTHESNIKNENYIYHVSEAKCCTLSKGVVVGGVEVMQESGQTIRQPQPRSNGGDYQGIPPKSP